MTTIISPKGFGIIILAGIIALIPQHSACQTDTTSLADSSNRSLRYTLAGSAAAWAGVTLLLNEAWYRDYPRSSFHLYNDWGEWMHMDKTGHMYSSYVLSLSGIELITATGTDRGRAIWIGGMYGPVFLASIEILDGFSKEWGFSLYDMAANFAGAAIAVSQEILWDRQVVRLKYSYHESGLAQYRPDVLGRNLPERMLKDYNGHTHWISVNLSHLTGQKYRIPAWLGIAAGIGADGMLGGYSNPTEANGIQLPRMERKRKFYFAPDIDLSAIQTGWAPADFILSRLAFLKFPLPAVEFCSKNGVAFHLLFF